ncbi:cellulase family glycosylhydrolase [Micromonospora sp. H33]|uniref:cellulase family glycosylhydrolase n=1 Tax=Micromonospora sp. H33 TaxID=3452215 RepID=UPI003F88C2D0
MKWKKGAALLAIGTLLAAATHSLAQAAPTRYEAENVPAALPEVTDYQAENCTPSQGVVESNHAGFTGTGFVNYDNVGGSYVECSISAATAGQVQLTFRHANGSTANRPMSVSINGTVVNANLAFNPTGAWTTWAEVSITVSLNAGGNAIRATATTASGGPNLDRVRVGGSPSPPPGATPVDINGQLRVCGTKLCNKYNQPIQLRGMSTHGLQWYHDCLNTSSLDALANDWKADVIRISMYIQEGGYETNPRLFTDRVHSLINMATARGMYAIVDWHMLTPGDPWYNLDRAKTFFAEIASTHKNKVNVLYEVANEPNGVGWSRIKSYHEQIVPVIRAQDADSVILLGTRAWSSLGVSDGSNETEVINNPVNATNVMYTFHFYAASHGSTYLNTLSRAADRIPMFVTEFGTQEASGDGGNNFTMSQQYIDLMTSKKISWVNWNFSDDFRTGAVFTDGTCPGGPFAGTTRLKSAGVWVRDRIRTADNFPTT